jgi:hypothetical protein
MTSLKVDLFIGFVSNAWNCYFLLLKVRAQAYCLSFPFSFFDSVLYVVGQLLIAAPKVIKKSPRMIKSGMEVCLLMMSDYRVPELDWINSTKVRIRVNTILALFPSPPSLPSFPSSHSFSSHSVNNLLCGNRKGHKMMMKKPYNQQRMHWIVSVQWWGLNQVQVTDCYSAIMSYHIVSCMQYCFLYLISSIAAVLPALAAMAGQEKWEFRAAAMEGNTHTVQY